MSMYAGVYYGYIYMYMMYMRIHMFLEMLRLAHDSLSQKGIDLIRTKNYVRINMTIKTTADKLN